MTAEVMEDMQFNMGVSEDCLRNIESSLAWSLPLDYVNFLRSHDGGEGFIGDNYLILWKAEELIVFNYEYEVEQYAPGIFLFGTNGGGDGYGFDVRDEAMPVVRVPFIGMDLRYARLVSMSFCDFINTLAK